MGNRIIKESICTSDSLDKLNFFEEVLFYHLMVKADDYGVFDGRPAIIKGACFPLRPITDKQITAALTNLATAGLVYLYTVDGKPYLQFSSWERHQQIRSKRHKYPEKPVDIDCNHLISDDIKCSFNTIQSNPNTNPNSNPSFCTEPDEPTPVPPAEPPVYEMTLNDGSKYPIMQSDIDTWSGLYKAVDVDQEIRAMIGWIDGNPTKRKTKAGIRRFITSWLARAQDSGGTKTKATPAKAPAKNKFINFEQSQTDYDAIARQKLLDKLRGGA